MPASIKIYPNKIYTTLARTCTYQNVLPNFVQPVFAEHDGLMYEPIGYCVGPEKKDGLWLSYRRKF